MTLGLIGFSGTGKTSLAEIASKEGFRVFDSDLAVEKQTGLKIDEIFQKFGENYFRKIENSILENLVVKDFDLIAFGGGVNSFSNVWSKIREQNLFVCYLKEKPEILFERISDKRPLLKGLSQSEFEYFFEQREKQYKNDCDLIFEVSQKSLIAIFKELKVYI